MLFAYVSVAIELVERRKEILDKLQNSQAEAQKVMDVIENPEVIQALRQDKLQNLQFLKDNYGVCIFYIYIFCMLPISLAESDTLSDISVHLCNYLGK